MRLGMRRRWQGGVGVVGWGGAGGGVKGAEMGRGVGGVEEEAGEEGEEMVDWWGEGGRVAGEWRLSRLGSGGDD